MNHIGFIRLKWYSPQKLINSLGMAGKDVHAPVFMAHNYTSNIDNHAIYGISILNLSLN